MADAQVSGTCGGNTMWVQLPSSAPYRTNPNRYKSEFGFFTNEYFGLKIKLEINNEKYNYCGYARRFYK